MPKTKKQPFETISILLDRQDIEYLSRLLYTIETDKELRHRLIPQKPERITGVLSSNFVRVEHKLNTILNWFSPNTTITAIQAPSSSYRSSRLEARAKRKKPTTAKSTKTT